MKWISLIAGGAAGTLARFVLTGVIQESFSASFPYGTLVVNLMGCFLIGFFTEASGAFFSPEARIFLIAGFCGAFTTFSTLIVETSDLARGGDFFRAVLYIFLSVLAGLAVFKLGIFLAQSLK